MPTIQEQLQTVADAIGYVPSPLTPEQLAIQQLGSKTDNAAAPVSNPPDPQVPTPPAAPPPVSSTDTSAAPVDTTDPLSATQSAGQDIAVPASNVQRDPGPVDTTDPLAANNAQSVGGLAGDNNTNSSAGSLVGQVVQANDQQTVSNLQFAANTDWRVTLRLAPGATYLYNDAQAGLLQPLKVTNGVIFPYTPAISTAYKANYSSYDLTHSNYRGYFYQNSYVDVINLTATFTAQSTSDAAYVLAVIHFFRSVTKMFYGQDAQRGSPPPLVFLSGLGDYQFNNHPCLVQQFNYTMPPDVDYISSGTPNNPGLNLQPLQNLYSTTLNAVAPTVTRLANAFLPPGAQNALPAPLQSLLSNPTYVPTKMDMTLTLLPVQSRQQVSQQFSLKNFANGQLLKGGFW